jgi:hypothetical protein
MKDKKENIYGNITIRFDLYPTPSFAALAVESENILIWKTTWSARY